MTEYYIGLMSGTSIDAIDVAIAQFDEQETTVFATDTHCIPEQIKHAILSLCNPADNEIDRMGALDFQLGKLFAEAATKLINQSGIHPSSIKAIGCHGQTIRHRPDGKYPFTLQIGNPAMISQLCKITTIADFRRADIAVGGQGAPLAPAFHQAFFSHKDKHRVILNIGGMANISILPAGEKPAASGFDTGPGNALLNAWIQANKNKSYDENGTWSSSCAYDPTLLDRLLTHTYFKKRPPKSTGRETFNLQWLNGILDETEKTKQANVVQSTLCELSARSIATAITQYAPQASEILVCGGGAHNGDLISRIGKLTGITIRLTDELGVNVDYVEAVAFAWLAKQTMLRQPSNLPAVTGAREPVILGAIYPRFASGT